MENQTHPSPQASNDFVARIVELATVIGEQYHRQATATEFGQKSGVRSLMIEMHLEGSQLPEIFISIDNVNVRRYLKPGTHGTGISSQSADFPWLIDCSRALIEKLLAVPELQLVRQKETQLLRILMFVSQEFRLRIELMQAKSAQNSSGNDHQDMAMPPTNQTRR